MRHKLFPLSLIALALVACGDKDVAQTTEPAKTPEVAAPSVTEKAVEQVAAVTGMAKEEVAAAADAVADKAKEAATEMAQAAGVPVKPVQMHGQQAAAAIKTFAKTLQGELKAAMSAGGAPNAISVCNEKAPKIAKQMSDESGYKLRRVSLKNRNPNQEAKGWTKEVLEDFEARLANGEDIKKLAFKTIVTKQDGTEQFRMMKAIPTGKVCLNCHGSDLKEPVAAKLQELYPDDKATGYSEGQIRGAFVVTKDL